MRMFYHFHLRKLVILAGIFLILTLAGCGGAATADLPEELFDKEWKTTIASLDIAGIGGGVDMEMVFYRNGDVRASVPLIARYTGQYTLADEGLLRFDWEEEIIGAEERRELTEFWQFTLNDNELVLINDETGEERVFVAQ